MGSVAFQVPGQPQGKGRPRIGRVGNHARMFTPVKTVAYEGLVAHVAHEAMAGRALLEGPVGVTMFLNCQIPASWSKKKRALAVTGEIRPTTKPDMDNVVKACFDGMNGVVFADDVQVARLQVEKWYSEIPMVDIHVFQLTSRTAGQDRAGECV